MKKFPLLRGFIHISVVALDDFVLRRTLWVCWVVPVLSWDFCP